MPCDFCVRISFPASAQDRTTEQGEAQISDPTLECTSYQYPPLDDAQSNFPSGWAVATILPGDSDAQAKYQSIEMIPDCWWTYSTCTTPNIPDIPDDIAELSEPNTLGYGFDDGPNCSHNAFLRFFTVKKPEGQVTSRHLAAMFYIGSNVQQWPLEAQRALADGHQICVHTWSHHYMTALTNDEAFAELWYSACKLIKLVIGVTPTCWRPPYGDVDDRIRAIAHALGLTTIMWQYDSEDWLGIGSEAKADDNYMNLITAAQNGTFSTCSELILVNSHGTIMLTHELTNFTMSEAVNFYDQLASAFSYLVPVGVALNVTAPYVEDGYTLPTFEEYIGGMHVVSIAGSDGGDTSDPSVGGSSDGSGTSGSTTSGNSTNASTNGAAKVLLNHVGSFASAAVLVVGIQLIL
ncbi:carbohydrate esterase family 4 protein [Pisolithus marmoratus]|nr:carbohydrate esterase family 4 protein [Pisolithus marmoratus]